MNRPLKKTIALYMWRNVCYLVLLVLLMAVLTSCSLYEMRMSLRNTTKRIEAYHHSRLGNVKGYKLQEFPPEFPISDSNKH